MHLGRYMTYEFDFGITNGAITLFIYYRNICYYKKVVLSLLELKAAHLCHHV